MDQLFEMAVGGALYTVPILFIYGVLKYVEDRGSTFGWAAYGLGVVAYIFSKYPQG